MVGLVATKPRVWFPVAGVSCGARDASYNLKITVVVEFYRRKTPSRNSVCMRKISYSWERNHTKLTYGSKKGPFPCWNMSAHLFLIGLRKTMVLSTQSYLEAHENLQRWRARQAVCTEYKADKQNVPPVWISAKVANANGRWCCCDNHHLPPFFPSVYWLL